MYDNTPAIVLSIGLALCIVSPLAMYWVRTLPQRCKLPKGSHVHLDIETGGVVAGSAVFVIAAHAVTETGKAIKSQVWRITPDSALQYGSFDASTKKWWSEQTPAAYDACFVEGPRMILPTALRGLSEFIQSLEGDVYVWGNSPTIDCTLLRTMYDAVGQDTPWKYYREMDVRTLATVSEWLGQDVKRGTQFEGLRYVALDDARHQAKYTSRILGSLRVVK